MELEAAVYGGSFCQTKCVSLFAGTIREHILSSCSIVMLENSYRSLSALVGVGGDDDDTLVAFQIHSAEGGY